jgi:hypothetical protein
VLEEQDGVGWSKEAAAEIEDEIQREAGRIAVCTTLNNGPVLRRRLVWMLTG